MPAKQVQVVAERLLSGRSQIEEGLNLSQDLPGNPIGGGYVRHGVLADFGDQAISHRHSCRAPRRTGQQGELANILARMNACNLLVDSSGTNTGNGG